jgi:hypothetical protein
MPDGVRDRLQRRIPVIEQIGHFRNETEPAEVIF